MLQGRIVLITGATGGIGSAVARTVIAEGGRAILHDRRIDDVRGLVADLGDQSTALAADLADPAATQQLWHEAAEVHGHVDVLVNNASLFRPLLPDATLEQWTSVWNQTLAVNLVAPSILCREAVTHFASQNSGGVIINVASVTAFRGALPDYWHYGAAKGGVVAMTRTIARFYGRSGVTAFVVAPGFVDTPMARSVLDADGLRQAAEANALGEVTQPQDVANVIAFLATGRAKHATGSVIDINAANFTR